MYGGGWPQERIPWVPNRADQHGVHGSAVYLPELRQILETLARSLDQHLELRCFDDRWEVACTQAALADCWVKSLLYHGSQPCRLPTAVQRLRLVDTCQCGASARRWMLPGLSSMSHLVELSIAWSCPGTAMELVYTLRRLASMQFLQRLTLDFPDSGSCAHAAPGLHKLTPDELSLSVLCHRRTDTSRVLSQLGGLVLHTLDLSLMHWLTPADEALLAGCSISSRLVLRFKIPSSPSQAAAARHLR